MSRFLLEGYFSFENRSPWTWRTLFVTCTTCLCRCSGCTKTRPHCSRCCPTPGAAHLKVPRSREPWERIHLLCCKDWEENTQPATSPFALETLPLGCLEGCLYLCVWRLAKKQQFRRERASSSSPGKIKINYWLMRIDLRIKLDQRCRATKSSLDCTTDLTYSLKQTTVNIEQN